MAERQQREKMQAQQQQGEKQDEKELSKAQEKDSKKEQNEELGQNNQRRDVSPDEARAAALKERLGKLERWGVLPPRVTEEMLSTTGKEAPAEYRDIVSRYYKRMTKFYNRSR